MWTDTDSPRGPFLLKRLHAAPALLLSQGESRSQHSAHRTSQFPLK